MIFDFGFCIMNFLILFFLELIDNFLIIIVGVVVGGMILVMVIIVVVIVFKRFKKLGKIIFIIFCNIFIYSG